MFKYIEKVLVTDVLITHEKSMKPASLIPDYEIFEGYRETSFVNFKSNIKERIYNVSINGDFRFFTVEKNIFFFSISIFYLIGYVRLVLLVHFLSTTSHFQSSNTSLLVPFLVYRLSKDKCWC